MRFFQHNDTNAARRDLFVQMVDEADHVTPEAGLTLAVAIVKAGSTTYAAIDGTSSEVDDGTYAVHLAADDLDTEGEAMVKVTAAGAAPQYVPLQVVRVLDEVHLAKAALVNLRTHDVATGVNVIHDDDGATPLRTLTPSEDDGGVTLTPS